jgi:isopenicillin N synthase-like dioxygenase
LLGDDDISNNSFASSSKAASTRILVPVIDVSMAEDRVAAEIRRAATGVGFFIITNHGVPADLTASAFAASKAFFALPLASKQTVAADENNRGYNALYEEILDPGTQMKGDTKEGYYIGREVAVGTQEADLPLHGPNQWPDEAVTGLHGWRDTMSAYHDEMTALGTRLLPL